MMKTEGQIEAKYIQLETLKERQIEWDEGNIPKYRAWLKEGHFKNQMVNVIGINFESEDVIFRAKSSEWVKEHGGSDTFLYAVSLNDVELLQWTTRKDKNKDDIYEGHILQIPYTYYDQIDWAIKVPYDEYILGVVTFNQEKACFGVVIPEDVDELSKGFNSFEMLFDVLGVECEIIGDKFNNKELVDWFESPELLEEAKTK